MQANEIVGGVVGHVATAFEHLMTSHVCCESVRNEAESNIDYRSMCTSRVRRWHFRFDTRAHALARERGEVQPEVTFVTFVCAKKLFGTQPPQPQYLSESED
jgi:hypothetical protein